MLTKALKIAILGSKGIPSHGGAERVVEALTHRCITYGHMITIYCRKDFVPKSFSLKGVRLIRISTINIGILGFCIYHLLSSIHCFLLGKYDIVHVHNIESSFTLPLLKLRYPVICTSHGKVYDTDKWSKIVKILLKCCELIFLRVSDITTCPSLALCQYYNEIYKKNHTIYVPNGVELKSLEQKKISYDKILKKINLSKKGYLVSATNRVLKTKGIENLVDAYLMSSIEFPLIIFSDWDNSKIDLSILQKKYKNKNIYFYSRIQGNVLWEIIKQSKIFIFPSYVETMSMMLLEAASLSIPIVFAETPNNCAIMRNEGIPFVPNNIKDLSEKISMSIKQSNFYLKKAKKHADRIKKEHYWDSIFDKYNRLYLSLSL